MGYTLLAVGALFALLLLLNNLIKAFTRRETVSFWDIALAFLAVFVSVTALIVNATQENPDASLTTFALGLALFVIVVSLITIVVEIFRPQRLRGSRGLLALFGGLLLAISTFTIPFLAVYFELRVEARENMQIAGAPEATAEAAAGGEGDDVSQILQLIYAIRDVLREELNADEVDVFTQLDSGIPLVDIIEQYDGDEDVIVDRISDLMRVALQAEVDSGEMNAFQGAILISQIETFVRIAFNANLAEFGGRFDGGPTPTGTRRSFLSLLTESPTATPGAATNTAIPTLAPTESSSPVPSATYTATPSPRPTQPPTPAPPTRTRYATRTYTPSPTPVTPCLGVVNYNLRLRAAPNADAETLLVIPFATTIDLYARNSDSTWWQTIYDGQTGWVDGQFMTISAACLALPAQ
jgi:hypothetical protein